MGNNLCPYCKEEIKADAIICKHCHTMLHRNSKQMVLSEIAVQFRRSHIIDAGPISPCKAACYANYANHQNKKLLNDCLRDCEAASAVAAIAEKLEKELFETFIDIVWTGGDIDPVPLESSVRERFSHPRGKDRA